MFKGVLFFSIVLQLSNNAEGECLVNNIPSTKDGRVDWSQVNFSSDASMHEPLIIFQMPNAPSPCNQFYLYHSCDMLCYFACCLISQSYCSSNLNVSNVLSCLIMVSFMCLC